MASIDCSPLHLRPPRNLRPRRNHITVARMFDRRFQTQTIFCAYPLPYDTVTSDSVSTTITPLHLYSLLYTVSRQLAACLLFPQHPPVLHNVSGVTPSFLICPRHLLNASLKISTHRPHLGVPPISDTPTCVFPSVSSKSPPAEISALQGLGGWRLVTPYYGTNTTVQRPIPTVVVSSDFPCPGLVRAQPYQRSHCVLAAALLTGFLTACLAFTSFIYKSILSWFIFVFFSA